MGKLAKIIIIYLGIITILGIVAAIFVALRNNKVSHTDYLQITNYSEFVENIPNSEQSSIEAALSQAISLNVADLDTYTINDAIIRQGSYQQHLDNNIYTTRFIVDIESINKSFGVANFYSSDDPSISRLTDFTSQAYCLDSKDLIFGDFECNDIFNSM
jgi:hypothetical protein